MYWSMEPKNDPITENFFQFGRLLNQLCPPMVLPVCQKFWSQTIQYYLVKNDPITENFFQFGRLLKSALPTNGFACVSKILKPNNSILFGKKASFPI